MLQRIQTLFLLIMAVAMVAFLLLPIWTKESTPARSCTLYAWKLHIVDSPPLNDHYEQTVAIYRMPYAMLGSLALLVAGLASYSIARFNKRRLQLQIGTVNSLLLTILLSTILYCMIQQGALWADVTGHYRIGFFMPVVAVVANLLANYFIRKDEALVQSANRIR